MRRSSKRMPALNIAPDAVQNRLDEVNAFLKHVDLAVWDVPERSPVMSLAGYIVYAFLVDKRTGMRHTFNRFDAEGVAELERLTADGGGAAASAGAQEQRP